MAIGFFGKLPCRGDFVRAGLPGSFVGPWDDWMQTVLPASKAALGDHWLAAWMEAPVWRFRLQAGACGPDPVCGVFMPSVDKAGRHFPFALASVGPASGGAELAGDDWLDGAEAAGIAALEHILEPDDVMGRLERLPLGRAPPPETTCRWWTIGAPMVPPTDFRTVGLPSADLFVRMLSEKLPADPAGATPDDCS